MALQFVPICHFCRSSNREMRWTNGGSALRCRDCFSGSREEWHAFERADGPVFFSGLCESDMRLNRMPQT